MPMIRLTRARFKEIASRLRIGGRACRAAERVLVDGFTLPRAGAAFGISKQAAHKAVSRIRAHALLPGEDCPTCGRPVIKSRAPMEAHAHD